MAEEQAHLEAGHVDGGVEEVEGVPPQILATPGMPERKAVGRRQARVRENLHLLPTGDACPATDLAVAIGRLGGTQLHSDLHRLGPYASTIAQPADRTYEHR